MHASPTEGVTSPLRSGLLRRCVVGNPSHGAERATAEEGRGAERFGVQRQIGHDIGGREQVPLHINNPMGNGMDARKLTAILYLNPGWVEGMGGEIRLFVVGEDGVKNVDLSPVGGRLLLFWSDEIPHEVLATAGSAVHEEQSSDGDGMDNVDQDGVASTTYSESDRFALTVWIPTDNGLMLHDERSKFADLKDLVHFG